jgi:glycosyltransferase involved in cell wall biosynthesis
MEKANIMRVWPHKLQLLSLPGAKHSRSRDTRKPHVVLLVDQFPKALGGGERVLLKLASRLPQYGFSVSIVTFFVHPESAVLSMNLDCALYVLPLRSAFGLESISAAMAFTNFLARQEVRIVQTFFESSDLWGGLVTRFLSDAKLVWSRRDMGILRARKHRLAYRALAMLPDKVFTVSKQVRQHVINTDRVPSEKVSTIYNGLDLVPAMPRNDLELRGTVLRIATVGNIRRVKGHDVLIKAAAIVIRQFPNIRFTIAGAILEQDYFTELQSSISSLGLQSHILFAGSTPNTEEFLKDVDIFVLPSRSEGFSNAIIEAMAAGLPVIATDVGGNAEAIDDQVSGMIVPPDNEKALAQAILQLCSNQPHAERLGSAAKKTVAERFTSSAMMEQTADEYRKLLYDNNPA